MIIYNVLNTKDLKLEFEIEFEHRFEEITPLYIGLIKSGFRLHLSEHYGDSTPITSIRIELENLESFHKKLSDKNYKYCLFCF